MSNLLLQIPSSHAQSFFFQRIIALLSPVLDSSGLASMQVIELGTLAEATGKPIPGLRPIHGASGIGNETTEFILNGYHNPAAHDTRTRIEPDAESISKCRL